MNFFSYLGKSKDSEQSEEANSSILEEKQLSVVSVRKNYTSRIKKLLYADSTKESLTDNEFLPYIYYDVKLNEFLYKTGKFHEVLSKNSSFLWNWMCHFRKNYDQKAQNKSFNTYFFLLFKMNKVIFCR